MLFQSVEQRLKVRLSFKVLLHLTFVIRWLIFLCYSLSVTWYMLLAIWIFFIWNLQGLVPFARCSTSRNFFYPDPSCCLVRIKLHTLQSVTDRQTNKQTDSSGTMTFICNDMHYLMIFISEYNYWFRYNDILKYNDIIYVNEIWY